MSCSQALSPRWSPSCENAGIGTGEVDYCWEWGFPVTMVGFVVVGAGCVVGIKGVVRARESRSWTSVVVAVIGACLVLFGAAVWHVGVQASGDYCNS